MEDIALCFENIDRTPDFSTVDGPMKNLIFMIRGGSKSHVCLFKKAISHQFQ